METVDGERCFVRRSLLPAAASATEFPAQDDFHSFTVDEVAERLRLSSRSVVRLVDEGSSSRRYRRRRAPRPHHRA